MFKWLLSKWYKHSPTCNCGWAMKPFEKNILSFIGNVFGHNVVGKHIKVLMVNYIGGNKFKKSENNA